MVERLRMKSKKLAKRYVVDSEKGGKTTDEIKEIGEKIRRKSERGRRRLRSKSQKLAKGYVGNFRGG